MYFSTGWKTTFGNFVGLKKEGFTPQIYYQSHQYSTPFYRPNTNTEDHLGWLISTFAQLLIQFDRYSPWLLLRAKGIPAKLLNLLEHLYSNTLYSINCIRVEGELHASFELFSLWSSSTLPGAMIGSWIQLVSKQYLGLTACGWRGLFRSWLRWRVASI